VLLRSAATGGWCATADMLGEAGRARNPLVLVGPAAGAGSGGGGLPGALQRPPAPARLASRPPPGPARLSLAAPPSASSLRLQCTAGSAAQAAKLTFTGSGLTYLGMALHDPGQGRPLVFIAQAAGSGSVGVASVSSLQSQGVELSSAAGAASIITSRSLLCSLALLPTGQLALSNISDRARPAPLWRSPVPAQGTAPFRLVLLAAGSLAVLDSQGSGAGAWSSQTGCLLGAGPFVLQVRCPCLRPPAA
jgi:hypothetical protein